MKNAAELVGAAKKKTAKVQTTESSNAGNSSNSSSSSSSNLDNNDDDTTRGPKWTDAVELEDGNLQIEFFDNNNQTLKNRRDGISACLINLEDTIRLAEWIPYHYATLPLGSVVIALDPNNSERGTNRTLELIRLWKDKIDITLWPEYFLPKDKRFKKRQSYVRERQVYFANQCLGYHKRQNRTWTLLTDNDEYMTFNYVHDDEEIKYNHPAAHKSKVKKRIDHDRKTYMHLRKDLPSQNETTILDFINRSNINNTGGGEHSSEKQLQFLPNCVRLPGIHYGGDIGVNRTFVDQDWSHGNVVDPYLLSTIRNIHHAKRNSKFSKVMIDVSRVETKDLEWTSSNHAKTIHNPSKVCGFNGKNDSGADYYSSLFRLNHYLGSIESYLERQTDYRSRSLDTYYKKAGKVNATVANWDTDIIPWMDVFIRKIGGALEARKLLAPLASYVNSTPRSL